MQHPLGDHLTYLGIFEAYEYAGAGGERHQREWCERNFLRHRALRSAMKIRDQLLGDAAKVGLTGSSGGAASSSSSSSSSTSSRQRDTGHDRSSIGGNSRSGGTGHGNRGSSSSSSSSSSSRPGAGVGLSLETRLVNAVVSGLFMNAARRCAHEGMFKSMPLRMPPGIAGDGGAAARDDGVVRYFLLQARYCR